MSRWMNLIAIYGVVACVGAAVLLTLPHSIYG